MPPSTPPDELWSAFLQASKDFHALAPWKWLQNHDVFGVCDPTSGEIGWVTVMGAGGELFGVALYLGDAGFDTLRAMFDNDPDEADAAFGQRALVLVFLDREELSKRERDRIRRLGVPFRGRIAYPQFESHDLNRLPIEPTAEDLRTMITAIEQIRHVAERAVAERDLLSPDRDGTFLVRVARGSVWIDERREPPTHTEEDIPPYDIPRATSLRNSTPSSPLVLELDVFAARAVMAERGRAPYAPAMFLALDPKSGMVLGADLGDPNGRERWAQDQLLALVGELRARPRMIVVQRPRLQRVLAPVAERLGIQLRVVRELPSLRLAREALDRAMERGG